MANGVGRMAIVFPKAQSSTKEGEVEMRCCNGWGGGEEAESTEVGRGS